jgi:Zn-dependent protease
MGRISLNPLRHIDLVGTILIPASILLFLGRYFPVWLRQAGAGRFRPLRNPKKDMLWVAAAGPAPICSWPCAGRLCSSWPGLMPGNDFTLPLSEMSKIGIIVNCVLMVLNLLPLPPLDGGRIAVSLLPHNLAWKFAKLERWGFPFCCCCYSPVFSAPS